MNPTRNYMLQKYIVVEIIAIGLAHASANYVEVRWIETKILENYNKRFGGCRVTITIHQVCRTLQTKSECTDE